MKKLQPLIYALLISSGILIGSIGNNNPVANEGGKIKINIPIINVKNIRTQLLFFKLRTIKKNFFN